MHRSRSFVLLSLFFVLTLPLLSAPAAAQEWAQEVEVMTRIEVDGPVYTFLDTLSAALDQRPEVRLRRSEQDETAIPYADLREQLYEDGIDLLSATHAFVRYRFDIRERTRLVETVKDIYFILRVDEAESDIPIVYLRTRDPMISELLTHSGVASPVNMKAITPFRELLSFPILSRRSASAIVAFGGRPLRGDFEREHSMFMEFLREYTMGNGGSYVLHTADRTVAVAGRSQ